MNCGNWKWPVTMAKYRSRRRGCRAKYRASASMPSAPFSSVAFGPSVCVLTIRPLSVIGARAGQHAPDRLGGRVRRDRRGERQGHGRAAAAGAVLEGLPGLVADPQCRAAGIAGNGQTGRVRVRRDERVVLVVHLVVRHARPHDDHAAHAGVLRVQQRHGREDPVESGVGHHGGVLLEVGGGLLGRAAAAVAAGGGLAGRERERRRRDTDERDRVLRGQPELGRVAGAGRARDGRGVGAEIDQPAGDSAAGRWCPSTGSSS